MIPWNHIKSPVFDGTIQLIHPAFWGPSPWELQPTIQSTDGVDRTPAPQRGLGVLLLQLGRRGEGPKGPGTARFGGIWWNLGNWNQHGDQDMSPLADLIDELIWFDPLVFFFSISRVSQQCHGQPEVFFTWTVRGVESSLMELILKRCHSMPQQRIVRANTGRMNSTKTQRFLFILTKASIKTCDFPWPHLIREGRKLR